MNQPKPYSRWLHPKTSGTYTVLCVARCSTNGRDSEVSVVYLSHSTGRVSYRELTEFMDGRFVPLDAPPPVEIFLSQEPK